MLLVHRGRVPNVEGRREGGIGICGRKNRKSFVRSGFGWRHRTRGSHSRHLQSGHYFIRGFTYHFFGSHDPTTPNRQGADVGEQYRSVVLYESDEDKTTAERVSKEIQESLKDGTRVMTQILPLGTFFSAESYHQNYYKANTSAPYCQLVIEPKIERVRKRFAELVKDNGQG